MNQVSFKFNPTASFEQNIEARIAAQNGTPSTMRMYQEGLARADEIQANAGNAPKPGLSVKA